jgi:hypothetical protein
MGKPLRAAPKLKLETGAFDEDVRAADLLQEYGAKISTLTPFMIRWPL